MKKPELQNIKVGTRFKRKALFSSGFFYGTIVDIKTLTPKTDLMTIRWDDESVTLDYYVEDFLKWRNVELVYEIEGFEV